MELIDSHIERDTKKGMSCQKHCMHYSLDHNIDSKKLTKAGRKKCTYVLICYSSFLDMRKKLHTIYI